MALIVCVRAREIASVHRGTSECTRNSLDCSVGPEITGLACVMAKIMVSSLVSCGSHGSASGEL